MGGREGEEMVHILLPSIDLLCSIFMADWLIGWLVDWWQRKSVCRSLLANLFMLKAGHVQTVNHHHHHHHHCYFQASWFDLLWLLMLAMVRILDRMAIFERWLLSLQWVIFMLLGFQPKGPTMMVSYCLPHGADCVLSQSRRLPSSSRPCDVATSDSRGQLTTSLSIVWYPMVMRCIVWYFMAF